MLQLNIELGNSPTTTLTQALPTTTKPANDFFLFLIQNINIFQGRCT